MVFVVNVVLVSGQNKADTILMNNGEKKVGKITGVNGNKIKFVFAGETLEYEVEKTEINEIKFTSGRVEVFNKNEKKESEKRVVLTEAERKGKIAVLPFIFVTNDNTLDDDMTGLKLQNTCYSLLKEHTSRLKIQDPMTTNILLKEEGLSGDFRNSKTPKDMALLPGGEFVVYGIANINNVGESTSSNERTTFQGQGALRKKASRLLQNQE